MATKENTDYLRFSAFAVRDLITRKLAQDSNYTDQVYPGSNLAILIDIVSYMYQTLMYNLNNAASETMWADTKIYENINRLSQFLGYNPHGMNPIYGVFSLPNDFPGGFIPRYSYIDAGETDSAGNPVFFSTVEDIELRSDDTNKEIVLYNGKWKLYNTVFTTEGTDWETFVLNGLRSDSATGNYIGNNFIHVYVVNPGGQIERYYMTDEGLLKTRNEFFNNKLVFDVSIGLGSELGAGEFTPIPRLYKSNDRVFNLRLDETKTYTITFGNGRQGEKPLKGSSVYVFYLDSNGPGLEFAPGQINGTLFSNIFSYQQTQNGIDFKSIFEERSSDTVNYVENVELVSPTMGFAFEESVDEIRDFAPNWFRMGNRLVTKGDYEYYVKNAPAFRGTFADVKCMNNWEYMATFYKWLYEMGIRYHKELDSSETKMGRRFLTQSKLLESNRRYADPADSNNIYLWTLYNDSRWNNVVQQHDDIVDSARKNLLPIKDLTHEPEFILPIEVKFAVCAVNDYELIRAFKQIKVDDDEFEEFLEKHYSEDFLKAARQKEKEELKKAEEAAAREEVYEPKDISYFINPFNNSYIEITIDDEVIYASSSLQNQIKSIIRNFFENNKKLGGYIDFNELQNQIFEINGVNKIRTVYKDQVSSNDKNYIVRNGISFASWSSDDILMVKKNVPKIDLEVSSAGRSLEKFQFCNLANIDINNNTKREEKIDYIDDINVKIIKRSAASLNTVAY